MGRRPDLDLSGILASFDRRWLSPDVEEKPEYVPEEGGLKFPVPLRLGAGPDTWSTCTELAVPFAPKWDVNGYYRALGVHPDATRRELREAYQALNGQSSAYLTEVFKFLLNDEERAHYDAAPLGQPYLDRITERGLKERARREARMRSALTGRKVSPSQVLGEWGYELHDEDDSDIQGDNGASVPRPREGVDSVSPTGQDLPRKAKRDQMEYSYYAWNTSSFVQDEALLSRWQEALSSAASRSSTAPKLSFGITSVSDGPFILREVEQRPVIFFPEGSEPTEDVARQALEAVTQFPTSSR